MSFLLILSISCMRQLLPCKMEEFLLHRLALRILGDLIISFNKLQQTLLKPANHKVHTLS